MPTSVKNIQLFFQEGSSDKVYHATLVQEDDGTFSVDVEWGRRGSGLNRGRKAQKVTRAVADKTFDKLVREKTNKGYEIVADDVKPAEVAPPEGEGSGSKGGSAKRVKLGPAAQLMNPIDDDDADTFLKDDAWCGQQKLDGNRVLLHVASDRQFGTNRNGQETSVPADVLEGVGSLPLGTIIDGELISSEYWAFDVLRIGTEDLTALGYVERWQRLSDDLEPGFSGPLQVTALAVTTKEKRALHQRLTLARAEGIVFKQKSAPYKSGRPSSGGTQRKCKFTKSADVVIVENAGNAYRMVVKEKKGWFDVGKVFSGTTNESRAEIDKALAAGERVVAEVRYLYATADFQLFQPVLQRLRDDKEPDECGKDQLVQTNKDVHELEDA
ncbi:MAG: WGR domain-containing protein [Deltaproteobacteria bacterium]|nr:WGR domain-containing protein [Deltaproteobacteria bacterium]